MALSTETNFNPTKILPFSINSNRQSSLDKNEKCPELLLLNCVKPVVLLAKIVGLFPLQIKSNGSVRHKWFSKEVLYSLFYIATFCATSALYLPFIYKTTEYLNSNTGAVSFISELIFFAGQYIASVLTLILNQWMAPRIARTWNQIQDVTAYFGSMKDGPKLFKLTFIITRALFIVWIFFLIGYTIFFCFYFWKPLAIYFKKGSSLFFIPCVLGYIVFCAQMSGHLLHTIVAGTFIRMLEHSLDGLAKIIPTKVHDRESFIKFYNTFSYIEQIMGKVNTTFAAYTIIQIIVMMTSTLVNTYFTIYFNQGRHRGFIMIMPPLLVVLYTLWLLRVCNSGERVQNLSKKVMKRLRDATVFQLSPECSIQITGLLGKLSGEPIIVTAAGFIRINRKLMAKVIVTMTTYLIFVVQIRIDLQDYGTDISYENETAIYPFH